MIVTESAVFLYYVYLRIFDPKKATRLEKKIISKIPYKLKKKATIYLFCFRLIKWSPRQ